MVPGPRSALLKSLALGLVTASGVTLAGCESQPTNTLPDGSSGTKPAEVVPGKGKKGGEAKSNKNTDLKDLIPKKDR